MITRAEMMDLMLEVTPTFVPVWHEFLAEWEDEGEALPIYLVFSDLARHIAKLLESGVTTELVGIFRVVERWCYDGDAEVREAVTIGLLEDLQNTNVVGIERPAQIYQLLGPQSKQEWQKVKDFWERGELICDD